MKQLTYGVYRVVAALLLASLLAACSTRGDVVSHEYMELELDGQRLVLTEAVIAIAYDSAKRVDILSVGARERADLRSQGFFFQLSGDNLRPGTYTTDDAVGHVNYHGERGDEAPILVYAANRALGTRFTVTLTALGRDGVRGTFSGTLRRQGNGDVPELVTVSNGGFAAFYRDNESTTR